MSRVTSHGRYSHCESLTAQYALVRSNCGCRCLDVFETLHEAGCRPAVASYEGHFAFTIAANAVLS